MPLAIAVNAFFFQIPRHVTLWVDTGRYKVWAQIKKFSGVVNKKNEFGPVIKFSWNSRVVYCKTKRGWVPVDRRVT